MHDMTEGAAEMRALAEQARTVRVALGELHRRWEAAEQSAPPGVPHMAVALAEKYPFGKSLDEVVAGADEWTEHLGRLADVAEDLLYSTAETIRQHIDRVRRDMAEPGGYYRGDTSDAAYADGVRGGMGGISGDMAAAFHPGVQIRLANLLDALAEGADHETLLTQANDLCREYLVARKQDQDTYSGRS